MRFKLVEKLFNEGLNDSKVVKAILFTSDTKDALDMFEGFHQGNGVYKLADNMYIAVIVLDPQKLKSHASITHSSIETNITKYNPQNETYLAVSKQGEYIDLADIKALNNSPAWKNFQLDLTKCIKDFYM